MGIAGLFSTSPPAVRRYGIEQVFCSARHTETFVRLAHYLIGYVLLKIFFLNVPKDLFFRRSGKDTADYE